MPPDKQRTILIVDDEPNLRHAVKLYLDEEGYTTFTANDGIDAIDKARERLPDLIVMDVMMPRMDGFETLKRLRQFSNVPIIMLTVKGEESDKVKGLQLGADDYVPKPFSQRELLSRIEAVLRRAEMPAHLPRTEIAVDAELRLDFSRAEVLLKGQPVQLSPTEYRLLYHLVSNPGRLMTYETLLANVWGWEYTEEQHYVRLYVSYLRQKLEPDPSHPKYILTEKGLGYKFVDYRAAARSGSPHQAG
jgi:DNA-binding response OmpR family regulator